MIFKDGQKTTVAPRAGAWIETGSTYDTEDGAAPSRPVRARGLKQRHILAGGGVASVAPRAGAWIETANSEFLLAITDLSRPVRARGLKQGWHFNDERKTSSRPVRARGLKQSAGARWHQIQIVAPRAGAWIETTTDRCGWRRHPSRPVRARGLKPESARLPTRIRASRPVRARGLKRQWLKGLALCCRVAPRAGAWIETARSWRTTARHLAVAPRAGAWIETSARSLDRLRARRRAPCGRVD